MTPSGETSFSQSPRIARGLALVFAVAWTPSLAAATPAFVGDAIPASLTGHPGDPARGRAIVVDRTRGLCLLCHSGPFPEQRFQGNLSPDLGGTGSRWSAGQLRLKLVDPRRVDPETIMPAFGSASGLLRVGDAFAGRPILTPEEIEDVVAFLTTLRD